MTNKGDDAAGWPRIRTAGFDGFVVSFGDRLTEPANRAALAFRDAIERAGWDAAEESSTSLVSAYLRFDPLALPHDKMQAALQALIDTRDWFAEDMPAGRRLWTVPTAFGGEHGPQLAEAAAEAGQSEAEAIATLTAEPLRVMTIGFAPGCPYLGELPPAWDIPRQTSLTGEVPVGGVCVAIRQLILFPVATPTGWRHIGRSGFRLFRPDADPAFQLRPGDEIRFQPIPGAAYAALEADPNGGATAEPI